MEDIPRVTLEEVPRVRDSQKGLAVLWQSEGDQVLSLPEREWTWNPTPSGRESMWNPTPSGFFFSVTILFLFVVYGFCVCLVCLFVFRLGLMTDDCF